MTRLEEETRIGKGGALAGQLSRLDLAVLDEPGDLPFARSGGQLLFHLISKLCERASVVITTNLGTRRAVERLIASCRAKQFARPHFSTILRHMNKPMTLNVRIGGALGDFVAANVGDRGAYENVSEYVRDLIRRDKERTEAEQFDRLKAELARAFAAPQSSYASLDADAVITRNRPV